MNYFLIFFFLIFIFPRQSVFSYIGRKNQLDAAYVAVLPKTGSGQTHLSQVQKNRQMIRLSLCLSKSRTNILIWKGKGATEEIWKGKEEMTRSRKIHLEERHRKDLDCLMTLEDR